MAKVTGPLYSMTASGKIADAMVFFGWKGKAVVRQWLIPLNRQSADQGDVRMAMGGIGRAAGKVAVDSGYDTLLRAAVTIPSDQTKQSYLVKRIRELYFTGLGSTFRTSYKNLLAEITGHTAYTSFAAGAVDAGIADFDLDYAAVAPFEKALGLYVLAKAAISLGFSGSPYTKTLAVWTATQIDKMVGHLS
jgi:hypothetical protein